MMQEHVAIVGPILIKPLLPWLRNLSDAEDRLPTGRGGTAVTALIKELLQAGMFLSAVSLDHDIRSEHLLSGPSLRIRLGPSRRRGAARDFFRSERAFVREALEQERPALAHAHWTYEFALGALAARQPTVVTVRDWAPYIFRMRPDPYRAVRLLMNARTLTAAKHLTATSPYLRDRLRGWHGGRVPVIPNAVPDESFRRRTRLPGLDAPQLLAVNNGFDRRKNVTALLTAFQLVRRAFPHARLDLVGHGYAPDSPAQTWASDNGATSGVVFHGFMPYSQTLDFFRSADLFVHPSLEEAFGMVLVEAMSQGLPVVAGARSGAVPWVLDGGRAGVLADVTQPRPLAYSIVRLLSSPKTWARYANAGYEHAFSTFRTSQVANLYLDTYRVLLRGRDRR